MNDLERIIEDCYKSDLVSDKIIKKIIEIIGQKEWQNLHNENSDVCTTMGELIITLDRIADLEKENAELRENNQFLNNLVKEKEQRGLEIQEDLLKEKEDFEKENAELRENYRKRGDIITSLGRQLRLNIHSDNFTKAKELITDLNKGLDKLYLSGLSEEQIAFVEQLQDKIEQFLKE